MSRLFEKVNILRRMAALLATLLICVVGLSPSVAAAQDSGKTGNLKWSFSGGTLEITGKGEMSDFTEQNMPPWNKYSKEIRRIVLDDRITHIGALAFYDCSAVTALELSEKVKTIGNMAFAGCSGLESITLPKVEELGEYAFSRCFKLDSVVLPETLKKIGSQAFYRCEALRSIRIPASVSEMGDSVFAYCSSLLTASIDAPIKVLPEWTFYGCERLSSVILPKEMEQAGKDAFTRCDSLINIYHDGSEKTKESFTENAAEGTPGFNKGSVDSMPETIPPSSDVSFEEKGEDKVDEIRTQITNGKDAFIETDTVITRPIIGEYEYGEEKEAAEIKISATISGEDGWDTLLNELERQLLEQGALEMEIGEESEVPFEAEVSLLYGSIIYGKTLSALAGKDIILKLITPNGSRWSIDCSNLRGYEFKKSYDLEYNLTLYEELSKAHRKIIGAAVSYWLEFADKIDFPATVELYIDQTASRQIATLYEKSGKKDLKQVQSVMVSEDGIAYYKMGNINKGKRYIAALNVAGIAAENVILPESTSSGEDWLENYVPVTEQYKITDVRGFMGLTMKEFTRVLIFGVIGIAFVVFIVILTVNFMAKKKALDQTRKK